MAQTKPEAATLDPNDEAAEEHVLGACLLSYKVALENARSIVEPADFYRPSHGTLFRVMCEMADHGTPVDGITLCAELDRLGLTNESGLERARVHELIGLVPAASNVAYYADIVRRLSVDRAAAKLGYRLQHEALNGGVPLDSPIWDEIEQVRWTSASGAQPFLGLTHAEIINEPPEPRPAFLIDELLEPGIVATIAGVPESFKSWLAAVIAILVATGKGEILGKHVTDSGPVGYFWEDDSTRNETERVQLLAKVRDTPADLPLHWFLNLGVTLPDSISRLRATIEEHSLVLCILDSFYNLAGGIDLKDTDAGRIVARLKREISDKTGCTVLIVDHMAWATQENRQRLHAYGDVFKNAATRAGIYIDAKGPKLWLEARGNNIKGIPRTPVEWDPEKLELRLVAIEHADPDTYDDRVLDFLTEQGWSSMKVITGKEGAGGNTESLRESVKRLVEDGRIVEASPKALGLTGRSARGQRYAITGSEPAARELFDDSAPPDPDEEENDDE